MATLKGESDALDMEMRHLSMVRAVLARHVPQKTAWAYGSRVTWKATEKSDLDCVVFGATEDDIATLRDAFDESDIPFEVQVFAWDNLSGDFQENIRERYFVLQQGGDGVEGWREEKLGSIADLNWGDVRVTKESYVADGYKAFSASGADGFLPYHDFDTVGVVISAIGASCGQTWLAKGKWSCIKNTLRFWSISDTADTEFLYWQTRNPDFWPKRGSAQPFISQGDARSVTVKLPPLPEQKAIAGVLGSLDDKIDLLHRQNKTLEALAETLFRQWFIEEENDFVSAKNYIDVKSGYAFKSSDFCDEGEYRLVTIKNVQDGYLDLAQTSYFKTLPEKMPNYCLLNAGDILLSLTGNVGRTCFVTEANLLLNQRVALLHPKRETDRAFVYFFFRRPVTRQTLEEMAKGTAQPNLSPVEMKDLDMPEADESRRDLFAEQARPLFQKLIANKKQILALEKLRDTLLPKLMSGEVRVAV